MNPRFLVISALAVSLFATSVPVFAGKKSSQYEAMTEDQREELLQAEIYKRLEGGMNSGGGNSIQGKVIESYRINYKKLKGYNEANTILKKLDTYLPQFATYIREFSDKKLWFLVPAEFSTIPREISGIPAHSEQTALNRPLVVWVSKPSLESKSADQAGILILHEMVMSYLRATSLDNTAELIAKTQVMTSLLLDIQDYTDKELAERVYDLTYKRYEALSQRRADELLNSERRRIYDKVGKESAILCNKYRIQSLAEKFANKKLSPAEDAYYVQGLRSITVLELKVAYPAQESFPQFDGFQELIPIAKNNKVYRVDLEGIRLSDKLENRMLGSLGYGAHYGMMQICAKGCIPERIEELRNDFNESRSPKELINSFCTEEEAPKKPDQYGW